MDPLNIRVLIPWIRHGKQTKHPAWRSSWYLGSMDYFTIIWVFPKIGVPQNGWFIMDNPETLLKWMILGGPPLFLETPI